MNTLFLRLLPFVLLPAGCGPGGFLRFPDPAVRVIAFGDSATRGPAERDYVGSLPSLTGQAAYRFVNEGRSGETTAEGLDRLGMILDRGYYPEATTLIYWEGGNDLIDHIQQRDPLLVLPPDSLVNPFVADTTEKLDAIESNIVAAVRRAKEAGLRVFVMNYFLLPQQSNECKPLLLGVLLPPQSAVANQYVLMLNERIEQVAANEGATLIDVEGLSATLREDEEYYYNCTHLSAEGNELVAQIISEAIQDSDPAEKTRRAAP